jgi:HAD superfamily hydrolase (TIGR01490 family)
MAIALFDLDNTLLAGDSDYLWGQYLCDQGAVDPIVHAQQNTDFYQQYQAGEMDITAFLNFALQPLREMPVATLLALREGFLNTVLETLISPGASNLIDQHYSRGDTLAVVTATNRFVTAPIVQKLGIHHLIATEPTLNADGFDGGHRRPPCFQGGKILNVERWLKAYRLNATGSFAYSDSHNDLPLLEWADNPVAVDPDPKLATMANERGWTVISLR